MWIYILKTWFVNKFSFYYKGCSMSSVTHYKCWKRDFLFLTLQKKAKKHHFLPFPPYLASFCKRDESNSAYYSRFSLYFFQKVSEFPKLHIIFIFKKVLEFSNILCMISTLHCKSQDSHTEHLQACELFRGSKFEGIFFPFKR